MADLLLSILTTPHTSKLIFGFFERESLRNLNFIKKQTKGEDYMKNGPTQKDLFFTITLCFTVVFFIGSLHAMEYRFNNGISVDMDVTLGYGAALRVKDQDPEKLTAANINADDGNRNFDQWDLINSRFSTIADIDIQYNDLGLFVRPRAFYDFAYVGDNANQSPTTNNNLIAGSIDSADSFDDETEKAHGRKAEFLDFFAYAGFDLGDRYLQVRAGRQVVQWGESLYLQGGISSAMAHLDATVSNAPGVELKEIYLPSGAISAQIDVTDTVSAALFYQYEWKKTRLNESGSYFSTTDFLDDAGHSLITSAGILERGEDQDADDDGQYGISLMYRADWLAESEFGIYFINYHEKTPGVVMDFPSGTYHLTYAEDVKLYGFSFSSLVGSTNISGEISYRQDYPVGTATGTQDADVVQAQVSWLYSYADISFCDRISFNGEVGANRVLSLEDEEITGGKDKFAWGYSITLSPQWYQILPDIDMTIPINYKGHPDGSSVNATFTEKADSGSIGLEFVYKNAYKFNLKYVDYFNGSDNALSDRDYIALDLKYTF